MLVKVVVDTNVIVSAAISPYGNPARIMDMILDGDIIAFYCNDILKEYTSVLSRGRLDIAPDIQFDIIQGIKRVGILTEQEVSSLPLPDESDRVFYDTAKTNDAILITGNTKHFPAEPFIMTPAEFLSKKAKE